MHNCFGQYWRGEKNGIHCPPYLIINWFCKEIKPCMMYRLQEEDRKSGRVGVGADGRSRPSERWALLTQLPASTANALPAKSLSWNKKKKEKNTILLGNILGFYVSSRAETFNWCVPYHLSWFSLPSSFHHKAMFSVLYLGSCRAVLCQIFEIISF